MSIKLGNAEINAVSLIEPYGFDVTPKFPERRDGAWVRPSNWPEMPVINSGEHKANFLIKVSSGVNDTIGLDNYFRFFAYSEQTYPYRHFDFDVDWGDGQSERINYRVHQYAGSGSYDHYYDFNDLDPSTQFNEGGIDYRVALIQIESPLSGIKDFNWRYLNNYPGGNRQYQAVNCLEFDIHLPSAVSVGVNYQGSYLSFRDLQKAKLYAPKVTRLDTYFQNTPRLRSVEFGPFDNLISIRGLFSDCGLDYYPDIDTSNVTEIYSAFQGMKTLKYENNYDLSNVSYNGLNSMFYGSPYLREVHIDIPSNITNMQRMFSNCRNLIKVSGNWDTSNVTNFYETFYYNNKLVVTPDIDLSSATQMYFMFYGCKNLRKFPTLNCPNLTSARSAFNSCYKLKRIVIEDMSNPNASDFGSFFANCINLRKVIIKNPRIAPTGTAGGAGMDSFFQSCRQLQKVPYIDMSGCRRATNMFSTCESLVDAPEMFTSTLYQFGYMFNNCTSLLTCPDYDITCEGTGNVSLDNMFFGSQLKDIPNFDWSRVNYAYRAFYCRASGEVSLDWSNLNYSTHTNTWATREIFNGSKALHIKEFKLSPSGHFAYSPFGSANLKSVPFVDASNGYNYNGLFDYCTSLERGALSGLDSNARYRRTSLSSGAFLDVFNGLASGVTSKTIDLREAPSAYILHPDTIAIATSKGWTVTT